MYSSLFVSVHPVFPGFDLCLPLLTSQNFSTSRFCLSLVFVATVYVTPEASIAYTPTGERNVCNLKRLDFNQGAAFWNSFPGLKKVC